MAVSLDNLISESSRLFKWPIGTQYFFFLNWRRTFKVVGKLKPPQAELSSWVDIAIDPADLLSSPELSPTCPTPSPISQTTVWLTSWSVEKTSMQPRRPITSGKSTHRLWKLWKRYQQIYNQHHFLTQGRDPLACRNTRVEPPPLMPLALGFLQHSTYTRVQAPLGLGLYIYISCLYSFLGLP